MGLRSPNPRHRAAGPLWLDHTERRSAHRPPLEASQALTSRPHPESITPRRRRTPIHSTPGRGRRLPALAPWFDPTAAATPEHPSPALADCHPEAPPGQPGPPQAGAAARSTTDPPPITPPHAAPRRPSPPARQPTPPPRPNPPRPSSSGSGWIPEGSNRPTFGRIGSCAPAGSLPCAPDISTPLFDLDKAHRAGPPSPPRQTCQPPSESSTHQRQPHPLPGDISPSRIL